MLPPAPPERNPVYWLATLRLAPVEGRQSQSDWHHLPTYLMLFTEFTNLTLNDLKVRERGLYGTLHSLSINNTTASKQSLQSKTTASGSLKMTLEASGTKPIIFNIKSYPCLAKPGSHSIQDLVGRSRQTRKQITLYFISIHVDVRSYQNSVGGKYYHEGYPRVSICKKALLDLEYSRGTVFL